MSNDNKTPEAPAVSTETAAHAAAPAPQKAKTASKKPKAKAKKKKTEKQISDSAFLAQLLSALYSVRANATVLWNDARLKSKEFDMVDKLIKQRPVYVWRQVGVSHYLEAKHDGSDTTVAYILIHDPKAEYKKALAAYELWLKKPRKGKTKLKEPAKPVSTKKTYHWHVANKKGIDENNGHAASLEEAIAEVMKRQSQFYV